MRALVLLWGCLALRASAALTCPEEVSAFEGDTVTVRCTYEGALRTLPKYWCKEVGVFISRCSSKIFSGEDGQEVRQGRVSIRDRPGELALVVTLRGLALQDSGKYWCGAQKLGPDDASLVALTVLPGAERPAATIRACCLPAPAPSFRPPPATSASPRPPALTSPDQRPTVTAPQQGHGGAAALLLTETVTSHHAATAPDTTATSPHTGSSRLAMLPDSSIAGDPGSVSSSHSSMPSASIPTARLLAPILVLLSLLLAAGLIALGAHVLQGQRPALWAEDAQRGEKLYFPAAPLGASWVPKDTVVSLARHPNPLTSSSLEICYLSQARGEEEALSQAPEAADTPVQCRMSEELDLAEFIAV